VATSKPAFAVSAARETIPSRFLTTVPSRECSFVPKNIYYPR
jgi:hypothetical protein